jgi:hypothetical protein
VRAESVLGDALLCMPPFLGQIANVDIIKVRPKAEVDFLRYKVIYIQGLMLLVYEAFSY